MASYRKIVPKCGDLFNTILTHCRQKCAGDSVTLRGFGVVSSASRGRGGLCPWQRFKGACNYNLTVLAELFAKQCNALAAQRIRRTAQILNLYAKIYDRNSARRVFDKFRKQFLKNGKTKPIYLLFSASLFSWEQEKIRDVEIKECMSDLQHLEFLKKCTKDQKQHDHFLDTWEKVIDSDNLQVWRRPVSGTLLYEYKVFGSFYDVTPRDFFSVQVDLDYRKEWDKLVIQLNQVDKDDESDCEVVHWVTHYPYPMYSRDYVYIRKHKVDYDNNMMVLVSRATEHPKCPKTNKYVRVTTYNSNMVIMPHSKFDENGFDYLLSYCDDPQANIPNIAYSWMASSGVPDFVEKLRAAAKQLNKSSVSKNIVPERESKYAQQDRNSAVPM